MKLKKYLAKGLALGIIISNLPLYSFADNTENECYNTLSNIETKEDLQKTGRIAEINTWATGLSNISTKRSGLSSVVLNGKIYCLGGGTNTIKATTLDIYDPKTDSWETKNLPITGYSFISMVINDKIYSVIDSSKIVSYDPSTDIWETKTNVPTKRSNLTATTINGKIYCIGGTISSSNYSSKVEVYDPITDSWETKTPIPTARSSASSVTLDGKIYCIGGFQGGWLNKVEVYDPITDSWETKTSMPTSRMSLSTVSLDGKIYCIGGDYGNSRQNKIEAYDPITDSWETKTPMPTSRYGLASSVLDGKIYCIGGSFSLGEYTDVLEVYNAITPERALILNSQDSVKKAENSLDSIDVNEARKLVNQLPEGELKSELQARLNNIFANVKEDSTTNMDCYIKNVNTVSLSLNTNSISFDNFTGLEDIEKKNAINITVSSSLPYKINAYMVSEMQNQDKSKTMDKEILNIKANGELDYQTFKNINEAIVLKDNCLADNNVSHGLDFKLKGGLLFEKDTYKTSIKIEVEQK